MSRRERQRAQTREEAKQIALRQLASAGPSALSLNAIAGEIGITGPGLYRYFAGRDELLATLTLDAYQDLADHLEAAAIQAWRRSLRMRMHAVAHAYRAWALAQPHRYNLLYAEPIAGYPVQARQITTAAQRAFAVVIDGIGVALGDHPAAPEPRALNSQLIRWAGRSGFGQTPAATMLAGLHWWSRIHGFITLEIAGNFAATGIDLDLLYDNEIDHLLGP
ncbi:MAG: TetR/AcrR family transcriptional regulator [Actinoallomurus sp.]